MIRNTIVPAPLSSNVDTNFLYTRPEQFLNLAEFDPGVTEIYTALLGIYPPGTNNLNLSGFNYAVFHGQVNSGSIRIDWGDGTIETMASNGSTYHYYDYNSLSPSTEFRGYRQVVLSAVPATDGAKFTDISIDIDGPFDSSAVSSTSIHQTPILDLAMSSNTSTIMNIGGKQHPSRMCEKVGLYNTTGNRLTNSQNNFWAGFQNLQDIAFVPYMHEDTTESHQEVFRYCSSLRVLPDDFADPDRYWFWNSTSFYLAFDSCHLLRYLPDGLFDKRGELSELSNVQDFRYMFRYCYNLKHIPRLPTRTSGSNIRVQATFSDCIRLCFLPKDFRANNIDSSSSGGLNMTFNNTQYLESLVDFDFMDMDSSAHQYSSINTEQLFENSGIYVNEIFPWYGLDFAFINSATDLGGNGMYSFDRGVKFMDEGYFSLSGGILDFTNVIDNQDGFNGNRDIRDYPIIKFAPNRMTNSNSIYRMFFNNHNLNKLHLSGFDVDETFGNGEYYQMFYGCYNLKCLSGLPFNAANDSGDYSSMFSNVRNLIHFTFPGVSGDETGFSESISLQYSPLTRNEIVNIFQYLKTTSGKTITLTNNNYADDLTAGELAIATGKGWTVST
jgi:hypothetical protein